MAPQKASCQQAVRPSTGPGTEVQVWVWPPPLLSLTSSDLPTPCHSLEEEAASLRGRGGRGIPRRVRGRQRRLGILVCDRSAKCSATATWLCTAGPAATGSDPSGRTRGASSPAKSVPRVRVTRRLPSPAGNAPRSPCDRFPAARWGCGYSEAGEEGAAP